MPIKPLISVVLPVYNGGDYLRASVQSVLDQDLRSFEFLVIDDCSTDGSWEYLSSLTDDRIKVYRNETNKGLFFNLNYLIEHTGSPLIKLWAQDDIMYSNCLAAFVDFHANHPSAGFSYSGRDMIDERGVIKPTDKIDTTPTIISTALHARIAYYTGSIAGNISNACISKKAFNKVGPFNEQMRISADFDMWVRLARDHDTGFIREKLIQLRDHSGQLSRNEQYYIDHVREDLQVYRYLNSYVTAQQRKEGRELLRNHKLVFYYTLMAKALLKGQTSTAAAFLKELAGFDNIGLLSWAFLKSKLFGPARFTVPMEENP